MNNQATKMKSEIKNRVKAAFTFRVNVFAGGRK